MGTITNTPLSALSQGDVQTQSREGHAGRVGAISAAFVGTYVPRQCGIATFTRDLHDAVRAAGGHGHAVIAIDGPGPERFEYPPEVAFRLHRDRLDDYQRAADFINFGDVDIVCVQHEFGIFGGDGGLHLLRMLRHLRKPVVTTLHTVLEDPEPQYRRGLMAVANWSNMLVTMTRHGRQMLIERYGIDPARVEVIPHGAPPMPATDPRAIKARFNLQGRHLLLTFGLLSPGKGIEHALRAVAAASRKHDDITYLIVGATHPEVRRLQGENYRLRLQRLASELGIRQNVIFYNQYVSLPELVDLLLMCDIYLVPYPNLAQAVSGTLSYAIAMGNAIVSTPFLHAREVLGDGMGVLVPPDDPQAMADALVGLLDAPERIEQLKTAAAAYGRQIAWPAVGRQYAELFERVHGVYTQTIRAELAARPPATVETVVEPTFDHVRRLTDDTGILQHAVFRTPDRFHGYCTDDNARALQVALMNQDALDALGIGHLTSRYLSFLHYAQREDGRFHNFMNYRREWLDDMGSEDCQGRAVWSLGQAVASYVDALDRLLVKQMLDRALPCARLLTSPRARAFLVNGLALYLQQYPESPEVRRLLAENAAALAEMYGRTSRPGWLWFEEYMTYANASLPQAMLLAGQTLQNAQYAAVGRDALEFLTEQVYERDHFSLVGNQGWLVPGKPRPAFAQQPIDACALVSAYRSAALVLEDDRYMVLARKALDWFFGANDLRIALYDFATGGCGDGLEATGANINQGAESTLCCLRAISLLADPTNPRLV